MTLYSRTSDLRLEISIRKDELEKLEIELAKCYASCYHVWGAYKYIPLIYEGYQDHGDPPGRMGVDRRLPSWIPRQEIPQWSRACTLCGLEQTTQRTQEKIEKIPVF